MSDPMKTVAFLTPQQIAVIMMVQDASLTYQRRYHAKPVAGLISIGFAKVLNLSLDSPPGYIWSIPMKISFQLPGVSVCFSPLIK